MFNTLNQLQSTLFASKLISICTYTGVLISP